MIRAATRIGLTLGAALVAFTPLHAQDEAFEPAFNAESDLDCAIFIGALMAESEAAMTPDNRLGLTSALTYFVGRYEAQRGIEIADAFAERYPIYLDLNPAELQQICSVRMRAFSARLQEVTSVMSRVSTAPPVSDPAAQDEQVTEPSE
ncbi:hypothetical protein [Erythrobacter sp. Alg231-14]|uniref:hypothetical protein n=1 Tax=Erythrobacter sp. Alg231-14 TaxID=1922225 RepID=UPI000D55C079